MKHTLSLLGAAALAFAAPTKRASNFQFFGVNEAGPEFGEGNLPGVYGTDYTWPTPSTIDTLISAGFNTFRVNTLMERMAPDDMTGDLDVAYMGNLTESVNYITRKGAYAMIVPHNYGRYYGNVFTDASAFKIFWQHVATEYVDNDLVIFDTNNEFHDEKGQTVVDMNQAAIDGIRAAGATSQWIMVEGNAYTGAWTWTTATGTDGKTNADTMGGLTDPQDKIMYEMHQYLDTDGSGTHEECVSSTIGSERLQAATEWLRSNGKVGLLGEFAGAVNSQCEAAVEDMLAYVSENTDVWQGALWWSAGPWWGDYMFSLEPTDGLAYDTYLPILEQYA